MTRRPVVVAAWLWAIVAMLWAGQASYALLRFFGPDVVIGALVLVTAVGSVVWVRRRGLSARAESVVTEQVSAGS